MQSSMFYPFTQKGHSPNLLKEKCISEVVRIGSIIIFHSEPAMESQVLHTVWCYFSGEAAGESWRWSLLEVKGLKDLDMNWRQWHTATLVYLNKSTSPTLGTYIAW